jgi:predicted type IV restriction endonuclease
MNAMPTDATLEHFYVSVREIAHGLSTGWNAASLNEAAVRQVIVLRLLQAAGFDIWNPFEIVPEETNGSGGRADLSIKVGDLTTFVLELKRLGVSIADKETEQTINYANSKAIRWALATNGRTWKVYDTHLVTKPSIERGVLEIELLEDNADVFAEDLYRLLERSVWVSGRFEDALKRVQSDLEKRNQSAKIIRDKAPLLEAFMLENTIADRSKAADLMVQLGKLSDLERDVLIGHITKLSPQPNNRPDLLDEVNRFSALHTNDATGSFVVQWSGTIIKPRSFRNLYLSLVEVAISRGVEPLYLTREQLEKMPDSMVAKMTNGRQVDKHFNSETARRRMKELLDKLNIQPGTLEIQYTGKTYLLP